MTSLHERAFIKWASVLCILAALTACRNTGGKIDPRDWSRLDYKVFTLDAPPGWRKYTQQAIDSYVAGLTDGKDSLEFDYGWYSHELSPRDVDSLHLFASDSIDGYEAIIAIPKRDSTGSVELSMDLPNHNRLSFAGQVRDPRVALAIFQSLRFKLGYTTRNSRITLDQFAARFPKTGHSMFQMVCKDCHSRNLVLVAPPLTPALLHQLGNDSIYWFLTRRHPSPDSNAVHCPIFSDWSRDDIDKIVAYLLNAP